MKIAALILVAVGTIGCATAFVRELHKALRASVQSDTASETQIGHSGHIDAD